MHFKSSDYKWLLELTLTCSVCRFLSFPFSLSEGMVVVVVWVPLNSKSKWLSPLIYLGEIDRVLCCGLFLSILVGCCWTIMFHSIKRVYVTMHLFPDDFSSPSIPRQQPQHPSSGSDAYQVTPYNIPAYDPSRAFQPVDPDVTSNNENANSDAFGYNSDTSVNGNSSLTNRDMSSSSMPKTMTMVKVYDAPFFTAWVLTICTVFFYPIHQLTVRFCSCMGRKGPKSMSRAVSDAIQGFRRCTTLCCLWVLTNWLIAYSLKTLKATEVLALFATTTSFLYLLSWVVLHQQFVGLRILAVILSNMGIALFAYMDGQTYRSKTITGVMVGATAAGTSAVFKVSLKKSFGFGATISQQVALIFSVVGIISIVVLWPIFLLLYFTGIEVIIWSYVPWELILFAVTSFLLVAMLDNFGVTCTFEFFITIGLLMAIPFSAVLDVHLYKFSFDGMCLAGIIVIGIGFFIVLLPENWPDYITRLIRFAYHNIHSSEQEQTTNKRT
ncbi:Solute carrier family 35 member F4 [Orchesella cincta]|uniref:Solute carrier family 35 member F4 n=1 Tax=Orchesella cincta TaxID=48709 RepID=A0A1D2N7G2_ORCCI|nr:Solute carrier family 35 member F4 [Orchesella cincta]